MSTPTDFLTGIANAIRAKNGTSATIPAQNFAAEIAAIQTGYDTADATGGTGQMLSPYTAYGPNGKFTGTIPSQNATTITPGTAAKTAIPAGTYAAGAATVAGDANLVAGNIKEGVRIFGVTGSFTGGAGATIQPRLYYSLMRSLFGSILSGTINMDLISIVFAYMAPALAISDKIINISAGSEYTFSENTISATTSQQVSQYCAQGMSTVGYVSDFSQLSSSAVTTLSGINSNIVSGLSGYSYSRSGNTASINFFGRTVLTISYQ